MRIEQITYFGSKQYELITVISMVLVLLTVGFTLTMLIQNETDKLMRTNFLQIITQRIGNETNKLYKTIGNKTGKLYKTIGNETGKLSKTIGNETGKLSKTIGNETGKLSGLRDVTKRI